MKEAAPGRVLRLAVIGWGLGHLALGRRGAGIAWLGAELLGLVAVALLTFLLADTTWYLLPFVAGAAFLAAWALQAVLAYRGALGTDEDADEEHPTPRRSPAAMIAWLTIPVLIWGTGFWLVAGASGSPDAVLDRFLTAWPSAAESDPFSSMSSASAEVRGVAVGALDTLEQLCADGQLTSDCGQATAALLRDVRVRVDRTDPTHATAVAEVVRYERHETSFLWIFSGAELQPVPYRSLMQLELEAQPGPLGSARWTIVNAAPR